MKVIIATDLSEASLLAVEALTSCHPAAFEHMVLLHVIDVDLYTAGGVVPEVQEYAEKHLGDIAARLTELGFPVSVRIETGPAVETIERVCEEEGAGLIVMTNLGKGAISGRLFGSTAERLASAGHVPVLIERVDVAEAGGPWCRLGTGNPFARPLVGTDLSGSLPAQLRMVAALPGVEEIRVVHVATDPDKAAAAVPALESQAGGFGAEPAVIAAGAVVGQDPAEMLAKEARQWDASVIVVSPRTHGAIHRMIWGSTAQALTAASPVPVLFVPLDR